MLELRITTTGELQGGRIPGVNIVALDGGGFMVTIDPIEAHKLQGSKRQLAALRAATAPERHARDEERLTLYDNLTKLVFSLSGFLEAYDWVLASPLIGLTDEGKDRIRSLFAGAEPAARAALSDVRAMKVDWSTVLDEVEVDKPSGEGLDRNVWATMADELEPMVRGPEGALIVQACREAAQLDEVFTFGWEVDWLSKLLNTLLLSAANARAVMAIDPARYAGASEIYRALLLMAMSAARMLVMRRMIQAPVEPPTATPED